LKSIDQNKGAWLLKPTTINHFTGRPLQKSTDQG